MLQLVMELIEGLGWRPPLAHFSKTKVSCDELRYGHACKACCKSLRMYITLHTGYSMGTPCSRLARPAIP